jgi:mannose-6-phosphate isomerase-like protein (cupin superfamily)
VIVKRIQENLNLKDGTVRFVGIWDTTLENGTAIAPHLHENLEEVYYIIEGAGRMAIDDEEKKVAAGDLIYIPPTKIHALIQSGVEPLRFITVSIDLSEEARHGAVPTYVA